MNELLQKHGCSNVFTIPNGLRELMADISREVLREQPVNICDFIASYLSALLITREHGVLAVKILDDLCDCRPSVSEHLMKTGMTAGDAKLLSAIIKEEIEAVEVSEGKEKVKEAEILKKILHRNPLDEEMTAKVCQIARNAYRDYWYRKKMMEQELKIHHDQPWEKAAKHTLEIYKKTKPSFSELNRATLKIQAAYRGYHVRRKLLGSRKPKKPHTPKVDLFGPPLDIAESREIDLGPVVDIKAKVKVDDMSHRFVEKEEKQLGLNYDTKKTVTHVGSEEEKKESEATTDTPGEPLEMETETSRPKHEPIMMSDETTELPPPIDMDDAHKITFGHSQVAAVEPLSGDVEEIADLSEVPTTLDADMSDRTASVPSSGLTTAATTDAEDEGDEPGKG